MTLPLPTRRLALGGALATLPAMALAAPKRAGALVYIGMHGNQIHAARFDGASGKLTAIGPVAEGLRPTWAVAHPGLPVVYFTDEAGNDGSAPGGVVAFRVDAASGALTRLGDTRTGGGGTTHLSFDGRSGALLTANYGGGSVSSVRLGVDGRPAALVDTVKTTGSGPHRRQAGPHPHATLADRRGRFIMVPDLGADRVFLIPFNRKAQAFGPLEANAAHHYVLPPGSGPRHLAAHPAGRAIYLINELTADIHVLAFDRGRLVKRQAVSLNDEGFTGQSSGGEIAVSADGRFVYASNRGDNTLVVHAVDRRTGQLSRIQKISSGGAKPWHFALHPAGWLLVANRDANLLQVFRADRRSGQLAVAGESFQTPAPVHVHIF